MFQNILDVIFALFFIILISIQREHTRLITSIFYIIDTLQDIMIEKFKEKSDEKEIDEL